MKSYEIVSNVVFLDICNLYFDTLAISKITIKTREIDFFIKIMLLVKIENAF